MDANTGAMKEMPKYKCHKEVWALKILKVELDSDQARREGRETTGGAWLFFEDSTFAPIEVGYGYMRKHEPKSGGYYVVYPDGYKSFSPAKAFEEGYTEVKNG